MEELVIGKGELVETHYAFCLGKLTISETSMLGPPLHDGKLPPSHYSTQGMLGPCGSFFIEQQNPMLH